MHLPTNHREALRESLAREIHEAREARGLSLRQAAVLIGISPANLLRIEQGKHTGGAEALDKIGKALGITIELGAGRKN